MAFVLLFAAVFVVEHDIESVDEIQGHVFRTRYFEILTYVYMNKLIRRRLIRVTHGHSRGCCALSSEVKVEFITFLCAGTVICVLHYFAFVNVGRIEFIDGV